MLLKQQRPKKLHSLSLKLPPVLQTRPVLIMLSDVKDWLTSAHLVIHDWFFSLIEGELFNQYKEEDSQ